MYNNIISELNDLEQMFSNERYHGCGAYDYCIYDGNIPVIISSPHSVLHIRDGHEKSAEILTGAIALYLNRHIGTYAICSTRTSGDPNYDMYENNRYAQDMVKTISNNNIAIAIDIHGAGSVHGFSVDIGTSPRDNIDSVQGRHYIPDTLMTCLRNSLPYNEDNIHLNYRFAASKQNTITRIISDKTGIACLQLEISRSLRDTDSTENVCGLIGGLSTFITSTIDNIQYIS